MSTKTKTAKWGLKAAKAAPAKGRLAKTGAKIGRRRVQRSPAGTAVYFSRALVGNEAARDDLRTAYASARKAYVRSSDRRGRPDLVALFDDRKARREAGKAATALRAALQTAGRTRTKPKSRKVPVIAVVAVAGAGTAVALNGDLRAKLTGSSPDSDSGAGATNGTPAGAGAGA